MVLQLSSMYPLDKNPQFHILYQIVKIMEIDGNHPIHFTKQILIAKHDKNMCTYICMYTHSHEKCHNQFDTYIEKFEKKKVFKLLTFY